MQGSASYGGVKQNADAEAVYKCAEALHSLQDGCDIEQFPFTIRKASSNPSDAVVLDLAEVE